LEAAGIEGRDRGTGRRQSRRRGERTIRNKFLLAGCIRGQGEADVERPVHLLGATGDVKRPALGRDLQAKLFQGRCYCVDGLLLRTEAGGKFGRL